MAFNLRGLGVVGYVSMVPDRHFTYWHYFANAAGDSIEALLQSGYFANASDMLTPGDRIMVQATDGAVDLYVAGTDPVQVVEMARATTVPEAE